MPGVCHGTMAGPLLNLNWTPHLSSGDCCLVLKVSFQCLVYLLTETLAVEETPEVEDVHCSFLEIWVFAPHYF